MAFKLPFLKGKCNSDGSLDCHGLPLFEWKQLRDKEEAIGRGSYGLVFGMGLMGLKSEHIVRFQAVCMEPCAMMLEYLFFDFAPFGSKLEELVK